MTQNKPRQLAAIVTETAPEPDASIIWLHGLGADGHDFAGIVPMLRLPSHLAVRFIFPHAPSIPVTINQGMVMPAWYDIVDTGFTRQQDKTGIEKSAQAIASLVKQEIEHGIPSARILLAGFSQGGAIALHAGLRYTQRLGGIIALSTYLPLASTLEEERSAANQDLPILMAHGTADSIVPLGLAEQSRTLLEECDYNVDWLSYPIEHSLCPEEIEAIGDWIKQRLANAD
jgi:phospholipase/carboxylesterase